jgi:hypothetical protein
MGLSPPFPDNLTTTQSESLLRVISMDLKVGGFLTRLQRFLSQ